MAIAVSRLIGKNSAITKPNTPSASDAMAAQFEVAAADLDGDCTASAGNAEPLEEENNLDPFKKTRRDTKPGIQSPPKKTGIEDDCFHNRFNPRDQRAA